MLFKNMYIMYVFTQLFSYKQDMTQGPFVSRVKLVWSQFYFKIGNSS